MKDPEAEGYCLNISRLVSYEKMHLMHEMFEKKKERTVPQQEFQLLLENIKNKIALNSLPNLYQPAANRWLILNSQSGEILHKKEGKNNRNYYLNVRWDCLLY